MNSSEDCIQVLKGIGEKTENLFQKAGIYTIGDLLAYYPHGYEIYEEAVSIAELQEGKTYTVTGMIYGSVQVRRSAHLQVTTLYVKDMTGVLKVIWYRMPYLRSTLSQGAVITLRGKIIQNRQELVMQHPEMFYPASKYEEKRNSLQPQYSLASGLTNYMVVKAVRQALEQTIIGEGILPEWICKTYDLIPYPEALANVHFPKDKSSFYRARKRLVFEEFLLFLLALRRMGTQEEQELNHYCFCEQEMISRFLSELPFELTHAQKTVYQEIKNDMTGIHVMSRLVQGDVGSGKTIVAVLAMMFAGLNGYQAAMMAPTEVLARQHYELLQRLFTEHEIPLKIELLTGSMSAKQKREAYDRIAAGSTDIIVGTHALIQDKVAYRQLALVVTDEQHRFGVRQRAMLAAKGLFPHILVMSATPIPRSLAMILYGDMDISVIRELPKNRLPIKNCVVDTSYRSTAYRFLKDQVSKGRQCYLICPKIEANDEASELENVTDYAVQLQEKMGDEIRISCLHGRMKPEQKDEIMTAFSHGEIQILVSTTVVEVGIDVPNATVIMIENAEHFGLAQLHQLRGRVGRGQYQSYCIFMTPAKDKTIRKRLEILNHSNDGFHIAEEDLRLRGPGDLFGIRQSGIMDFQLGDVFQDAEILKNADAAVEQLLANDPQLKQPENEALLRRLEQLSLRTVIESTL